MYNDLTTADVLRHWALAAKWAREYGERATTARHASKRGAMLAASAKWHDERHAAAEELRERLERAVGQVANG